LVAPFSESVSKTGDGERLSIVRDEKIQMPARSGPNDIIKLRVNGDVDVNRMARFVLLLTVLQSSFVDMLRA
jgi:hypothetical protein